MIGGFIHDNEHDLVPKLMQKGTTVKDRTRTTRNGPRQAPLKQENTGLSLIVFRGDYFVTHNDTQPLSKMK